MPGAGGKLLLRDNADAVRGNHAHRRVLWRRGVPTARPRSIRCHRLRQYAAHGRRARQRVLRLHRHRRQSGGSRSAASRASTRSASAPGWRPRTAAGDASIAKPAMNSAPALSADASDPLRRGQCSLQPGNDRVRLFIGARQRRRWPQKSSVLLDRSEDPATPAGSVTIDLVAAVGPDGDVYLRSARIDTPARTTRAAGCSTSMRR